MSKNIEYLVDTDIIIDHLLSDKKIISNLELAMMNGICFTTVLNSTEIYYNNWTEEEKISIDSVMNSLKVLGINSRYSLKISDFFNKVATTRDAMICVIAKINKLTILTSNSGRYLNSGIKIINPLELRG